MKPLWIDLGGPGELLRGGPMDQWQDHGLGLLRTIMHKGGVETDLLSTRAHSNWNDVAVGMLGYDIILMNVRSYRLLPARKVARMFKLGNPSGKVIVGGMHATVSPHEMEESEDFDIICQGAAEETIVDLVKNAGDAPRIMRGKGSKSMSDWPFIDRTLWPNTPNYSLGLYRTWPLEPDCGWGPNPVATVMTDRVCPWACTFCLTADTVIHTLGGQKTIAELMKGSPEFDVYSCDQDGNVYIGHARNLRVTQKAAPVWKVTLDDGSSFKATEDHPLMRRDGTYAPVKDLVAGDSLMPFQWKHRKNPRKEYLWIKRHPEVGPYIRAHHFVKPQERCGDHVHHINGDSLDNRPHNLVSITRDDHLAEHREELHKRLIGNKHLLGHVHSPEVRAKIAAGNLGKILPMEAKEKVRRAALSRWERYSSDQRKAIGRKISQTKLQRRSLHNHKIVSIEFAGHEDVYDLEVPDWHNFAVAGGVFVHNCNEISYIPQITRKPVELVIEELNWLNRTHGPLGSVIIHDSMFFQSPRWLEEWLEKYPTKADKCWPYWAAGRADTVRQWPELFEALVRETNWRTVSIGFESGSTRVLKMLNKECTAEDNYFTIDLLNKIGDDMEAKGLKPPSFWSNIMFAIPGETREDAFATVRMMQHTKRLIPSIAYYAPFPGSVLGEQIIAEGKSLLEEGDNQRYAGQPKVVGVDYRFYDDLIAGRYNKQILETSASA